jgi:[ribosomal protein S5]-alanine N-acetyltransferase
MKNVIEGEKIYLRPLKLLDVNKIKNICNDKSINKFTHVPFPYRLKDAIEFIKKSKINRKKGNEFVYGIINKNKEELMGTISFVRIEKRDNKAEIGYLIGKKYRNKGYMSEALRLMLKIGFEKHKFHKIFVNCAKDNQASKRVIEKCGLKQEALLRKDILLGNKYHDHYIHSMLKEEYKKIK